MLIWTFQPKEVAEKLQSMASGDYLFADPETVLNTPQAIASIEAYDFMARKLAKKIGFDTPILPWWGWHIYNGKVAEPDIEGTFGGEYLISMDIPEKLVLLSDTNLWYEPLLGKPCFMDMDDKDVVAYTHRLEMAADDDARKEIIHKTWERIFELHPEKYPRWNFNAVPFPLTESYDVQAVFPCFCTAWIKGIKRCDIGYI